MSQNPAFTYLSLTYDKLKTSNKRLKYWRDK